MPECSLRSLFTTVNKNKTLLTSSQEPHHKASAERPKPANSRDRNQWSLGDLMIRNGTPRVMSPAVPVPAKPQAHEVNSEQHFSPLPLARH